MNQDLLTDISEIMQAAVDTGLFVSSLSVQAPDGNEGGTGAPSGTYQPVTGLQTIQCMDAPANWGASLAASERKGQTEIESLADRHVLLDRYYPELSPATNWGDVGWQATVDGVLYDILGAECDSQRTQTRVMLQKVTL